MAEAPAAGGAPDRAGDDASPCILVVDDEPTITEEIVDWLELRGVACHSAREADEAMRWLERDPGITVMLTDINMPGMDGIALSGQALDARGEEHAMEVVVLTGHATRDHAVGALRARALDFIVKPASFATLEAALDRAHRSAVGRRRRWGETTQVMARLRASIGELEAAARRTPATIDSESRGAFLAAIGHEVLTALHQIVGFSELIGNGPVDMPLAEVRDYAAALVQAGTNLSEHTRMLLQLVECEAAPRPPEIGRCDVAALLALLEQAYRGRAADRQQKIARECPPGLVVETDAGRLEQVLRHLLANALRQAPVGATVLLAARDAGAGGIDLQLIAAADRDAACARAGQPAAAIGGAARGFFRDGEGLAIGIAGLQAARLGGRVLVGADAGGGMVTLHLPAGHGQPGEPAA